jgi:hypothetical protein
MRKILGFVPLSMWRGVSLPAVARRRQGVRVFIIYHFYEYLQAFLPSGHRGRTLSKRKYKLKKEVFRKYQILLNLYPI